MPDIFVRYDTPPLVGTAGEARLLRRLGEILPVICAEYLSCDDEDGGLKAGDFSVIFQPRGVFDIMTHNVQIRIELANFPARLADIDDRSCKIRDAVKAGTEHLDNLYGLPFTLSFYVWVRLAPAGFSAGKIEPLH